MTTEDVTADAMKTPTRALRILCAMVAFLAAPVATVAQSDSSWVDDAVEEPAEPRFAGTRLDAVFMEAGAVNLSKGGAGFLVGGHVGLGTLFIPGLDFTTGVRYWSAQIDRSEFGDEAEGKVKNFSIHPDLRAHLFRWKGMRPFLLAGLAGQFVTADIPEDESLEDALEGFRVAFDTGLGVASTNRNIKWRVEMRREFAEDVGNWTFTAGIGTWPVVRAVREEGTPERAAVRAPEREQFSPVLDDADVPASAYSGIDGGGGRSLSSDEEAELRALREENRVLRDELTTVRAELDAERARATSTSRTWEPPAYGSGSLPSNWTIEATFAFARDSSALTDAGRAEVRQIAEELKDHPDVRLVVEGHTDSSGDALENLTLSEQRAAAVRSELIRQGVDASRVRATGLGSTQPLSDDDSEDSRRNNQRVEIRVLNR